METGSFYGGDGRSLTFGRNDVLPRRRIDSSVDPCSSRIGARPTPLYPTEERNLSQKIDHLISLYLDNKNTIAGIQRENITTRKDILSLSSEVSAVKAQLEKPSEVPKPGEVKRKRIPTEISV